MNAHVSVKIAGLRELEHTQFTLVGFFSAVHPQVFCERRAVRERLLAHTTAVRPLTRMSAHVCGDGGALGETSLADRAAEGLFPRVRAQVCRQIGGLRERFVTGGATVGLFSAVCTQMSFEGAGAGVRLAAHPT